MKILVLGSGGREHALGWALSQSPQKPVLYFAPGNPGIEALGQRLEIDITDIDGLALFAQREAIDLTVVGPELPLSLGIVDVFQRRGLTIFGPSQQAAKIEGSKAFAKVLMKEANVPTAGYRFCENETTALEALQGFSPPYVIKQDGLAAGKGVTIAQTLDDAKEAIHAAFAHDMPVVIEAFLSGEEVSVLAICDGQRAIPLVSAQDFKRVGDGDSGPNTGGMGAYAPVPWVTAELMSKIQSRVLDPMMAAFQARGLDYRGVLYAGLMIQNPHVPDGISEQGQEAYAQEPYVVEFNARFGDPETQVVLPLLQDDLVDILLNAAQGDLSTYAASGFSFKPEQSAVTVVLASQGYPGAFETLKPITLPETLPPSTLLFQAGTKKRPDQSLVTSGGRVLNAVGLGTTFSETLAEARSHAYALAQTITYDGCYFRKDIAAVAAEQANSGSTLAEASAENPVALKA